MNVNKSESLAKKNKYSNITFAGSRTIYNLIYDPNDNDIKHVYYPYEIVPALDTVGKRKVKNFNISIAHDNFVFGVLTSAEFIPIPEPSAYIGFHSSHIFNWLLVYVPAGTTPSGIGGSNDGSFSMYYAPAQNVIASGVWTCERPFSMKSTLSRNLNSGDSIQLLLYYPIPLVPDTQVPGDIMDFRADACVSVNYAISF